jgi:DHA1 family tetracycline resistance protein-like MFS transporter
MSGRTASGRGALAFIFVTVLLDMLAVGIVIPVLPKLVETMVGGDTARAAEIYGIFGTVWALMQFLFMPIMGSASDRYGRRPVILVSCFGMAGAYAVMAVAPNLVWLLVGRILSGITAANVSTAFAYIADTTPPEKRAGSYGLVGAAFGLGFILGPAFGGVLGGIDQRLPFQAAALLALLNALYGLFILPESLPPEKRSAFSWKQANPVGSLRFLRGDRALLGLAGVHFVGQLAHTVLPNVFVLYAGYRYGWDERAVGLTLALVGASSMLVQVGLVRPVVARIGERRTLFAGLTFGTTAFLIYAFADSGLVFLVAVPIWSLWSLVGPATQGLVTRIVEGSSQGRLQGALSSLQGIAGLIGPGLFTMTFALFIGADAPVALPGAPFLLAALLLFGALILAVRTAEVPSAEKSATREPAG